MTDSSSRGGNLSAIVAGATLATVAALAASWALNYLLLFSDGLSGFARSAITATILPVVLVGPLAGFALWQRQEIRRARRAGAKAAARDPATGFVSQNILSAVVEERRKRVPVSDEAASGALLLLEVSELKRINARFGPEWSASVLGAVGEAVRKSVRAEDLVGRLETGEFGIFLPHVSKEDAEQVGQRVLDAVASVYFAPDGIERTIDVRVAGVAFGREIRFAEIIRHAAARLADTPAQSARPTIRIDAIT